MKVGNRNQLWKWNSYLNAAGTIIYLCLLIINTWRDFSWIPPVWILIATPILMLYLMIFWVKCLYIWYKHDKSPMQLICLFVLNILYTSFYYWKALKAGWLEEQKKEGEDKVCIETITVDPPFVLRKEKIKRRLKLCFLGFGCIGGNYYLMFYLIACFDRLNFFEGSIIGYYIAFSLPFVMIAWVDNIFIWARKDRAIGPFLLIFFYNLLGIFYFIRILKKKWV